MTKTNEPEAQAARSGTDELKKAKPPAKHVKLSPWRLRTVTDALKKIPIQAQAAAKAGIHPKTLAYWLKCSERGLAGYDIEEDDIQWRFHELCQSAIEEAHENLLSRLLQAAMGITYKIDPGLVALGCEGPYADAIDENGDYIEEGERRPNDKLMLRFLQLTRPERWARPRKKKNVLETGGVLVIDTRRPISEKTRTVTITPSQWIAASRDIQETKVEV